MTPKELLRILAVAEGLKCNTRHSYTSSGRHESVAEHSWRIALMAMLISHEDEFADVNMDKVIRMCLIHDLGECFTGDIPTFLKDGADEMTEDMLYYNWVESFPEKARNEFKLLLDEMIAQETVESKVYKSLDKLEAVIQHNEADISTWLPLEYDLQLTHGAEQVAFSPYLKSLREEINAVTRSKIEEAK